MHQNPVTIHTKSIVDVYARWPGDLRYDLENDLAYAPFCQLQRYRKNLYQLIQARTGESIRQSTGAFRASAPSPSGTGTLPPTISSFRLRLQMPAPSMKPYEQYTHNKRYRLRCRASPGSCAVKFKDGNNASTLPDSVAYNSPYGISWSDAKSQVQSANRAATGKIAVVNSTGSSTTSATVLNVLYSVFSVDFNLGGVITPTENKGSWIPTAAADIRCFVHKYRG